MNSSVTTGTIGLSATALAPVVSWMLGGCHAPVPDNLPILIATGLIAGTHALYNVAQLKGWLPSAPTQPTTGV